MRFLRLFHILSVSQWRREKLKIVLTIAGMTLGIAVYAAIRTANNNVLQSFAHSAKLVTEGSALAVRSSAGKVSESLIPILRRLPSVQYVAPYSSRRVPIRVGGKERGTVTLIGLDPLPGYVDDFDDGGVTDAERQPAGQALNLISGAAHHFTSSSFFPLSWSG